MVDIGQAVTIAVDLVLPTATLAAIWGVRIVGKRIMPHVVWSMIQARADFLATKAVEYAANVVKGAAKGKTIETPEMVAKVVSAALGYAAKNAPTLTKTVGLDTLEEMILARMNIGEGVEVQQRPVLNLGAN